MDGIAKLKYKAFIIKLLFKFNRNTMLAHSPLAYLSRSLLLSVLVVISLSCDSQHAAGIASNKDITIDSTLTPVIKEVPVPVLDTVLYNQKILQMVHNQPFGGWPVKTEYPLPGALLPFNRVIAFYGNLYSKGMGILGAIPGEEMLDSLAREVRRWEEADSLNAVIPALHYIAVTAQTEPGKGNKYRLRMPYHQIDKVIELAQRMNAIVFLDIQLGHSTLAEEIPLLRNYLLLPNVHLGIDPEYAMQGDDVPCVRIGTISEADINYATAYLAQLVNENKLPPKILVVHRFTKGMVTGTEEVIIRPEVQIVMHMDGFGGKGKKISSYQLAIVSEPVQFAGFKLFYKNDRMEPKRPFIMSREEILALNPVPLYIQYQ
jgi:hypothetical protein